MKPTISVCIATYNEEKNIANSLDSVESWVDEIIVVDGESEDRTQELVKRYKKARLIITSNKPMFHTNKNIAIDEAKSDWILFLDADEIISKELKEEILNTINLNPQ